MVINSTGFKINPQQDQKKTNSLKANVFNKNNQKDTYSFSTKNQKQRNSVSFGMDPVSIGLGVIALVKALAIGVGISVAYVAVLGAVVYSVAKIAEWIDAKRERDLAKIEAKRQAKIAELAADNPHLPKGQIEKIYDKKLEKTLIKPSNDGNETGLNKVMGMYDLKFELCDKVLMPLCEVLDYKNEHDQVPNGINFFGTPGTGKTFIAEQLCEHYQAKGGHVEKLQFTENDEKDVAYLKKVFADAEKRFIGSGKREYTIVFFDEMEKKNTPEHTSRTAELLKLTNNCKDKGVIFVSTSNEIDKVDPALLRNGRTDLKFPLRGIEAYEMADTINYYLIKNGMRKNIKDAEYEDIIKGLKSDGKFVFKPKDVEKALNNAYGKVKNYGGFLTANSVKNSLAAACPAFTDDDQKDLDTQKNYAKKVLGGLDAY